MNYAPIERFQGTALVLTAAAFSAVALSTGQATGQNQQMEEKLVLIQQAQAAN